MIDAIWRLHSCVESSWYLTEINTTVHYRHRKRIVFSTLPAAVGANILACHIKRMWLPLAAGKPPACNCDNLSIHSNTCCLDTRKLRSCAVQFWLFPTVAQFLLWSAIFVQLWLLLWESFLYDSVVSVFSQIHFSHRAIRFQRIFRITTLQRLTCIKLSGFIELEVLDLMVSLVPGPHFLFSN